MPRYVEFIGKEIQTAYLESYSEYGQNIFDRYVTYADFWIQDQEYRDPETGQLFDRSALNNELEKIEKPQVSAILKISVTKLLTLYLERVQATTGKTQCGLATKNSVPSLRKRCSQIQRNCYPLFPLMLKPLLKIRRNMTTSLLV